MTETRKEWHYTPDLPIKVSPLWHWPPRPLAVLKWYSGAWLPVTVNGLIVAVAFLAWGMFGSDLSKATHLAPGWAFGIFLRNLGLLVALAGGLHLWFYVWRKQGDDQKFDPRDPTRKGRVFTFGSQTRDNMFWSCASGATIWSAFEVGMLWAMANGWMAQTNFATTPLWFVAVFLLIPVWESFYFYWIHRFLHWPPLYRIAHAVHHRNTNVGPWSGLSMHPIEHAIYFGSVLVHFAIASHPVHIVFHLMFYALSAVTTHAGFDNLRIRNRDRMNMGMFHHQLHHRYFECNYGNLDVPWDKLFGSFHDGTPEAKELMRERMRKRHT